MKGLLDHVPTGRENAKTAREIWQDMDCWAEVTVSQRLNKMANAGEVKQVRLPMNTQGFKYLYWRE
jgi:hypothetical protein